MVSTHGNRQEAEPDPPRLDGDRVEAYFDQAARVFEAACARAGDRRDDWFRIAGGRLKLEFAGTAMAEALVPALAHLECEPADEADLTVHVWDSRSTSTAPLPAPAARASGEVENGIQSHYSLLADRFEVCFAFTLDGTAFSLLDHHRREAFFWIPDAESIPYYERGAPLRLLLHWWLRRRKRFLIHAAAVGTAQGGVLIGGRGGSGKSTTALSCVCSTLIYASDDYVAVSTEDPPAAHSIFNSAKVDDNSLNRFPELRPLVAVPASETGDKSLLFVGQARPEQVTARLPLRAILLPRISPGAGARPALSRTTALHALRSLAPSTMFQMPGTDGSELKAIAELSRRLPAFILELGHDMRLVPPLISDLIGQLATSRSTDATTEDPGPPGISMP